MNLSHTVISTSPRVCQVTTFYLRDLQFRLSSGHYSIVCNESSAQHQRRTSVSVSSLFYFNETINCTILPLPFLFLAQPPLVLPKTSSTLLEGKAFTLPQSLESPSMVFQRTTETLLVQQAFVFDDMMFSTISATRILCCGIHFYQRSLSISYRFQV